MPVLPPPADPHDEDGICNEIVSVQNYLQMHLDVLSSLTALNHRLLKIRRDMSHFPTGC